MGVTPVTAAVPGHDAGKHPLVTKVKKRLKALVAPAPAHPPLTGPVFTAGVDSLRATVENTHNQ